MATKDQKRNALNQAIEIAKEYARSADQQLAPHKVLEDCYRTILQITDEIEETAQSKTS